MNKQYEAVWNLITYHFKLRECVVILSDEYDLTEEYINKSDVLYMPLMLFVDDPIKFMEYIYAEKWCDNKNSSYKLSDISILSAKIVIDNETYCLKFDSIPNYQGGCHYVLRFKPI